MTPWCESNCLSIKTKDLVPGSFNPPGKPNGEVTSLTELIMKTKQNVKTALFLCLMLGGGSVMAQHPAQDPIGENLFPPELIMQHQQALGLTQEQKESLKDALRKAQTQFTEMQWQLQDEAEKLIELLKQARIDEAQALAQLDKVLAAEREIKRAQIALLLRLKNRLDPEQQQRLQDIQKLKSKLKSQD
jgi:Spy/CpxP family protein refolding chaperone